MLRYFQKKKCECCKKNKKKYKTAVEEIETKEGKEERKVDICTDCYKDECCIVCGYYTGQAFCYLCRLD